MSTTQTTAALVGPTHADISSAHEVSTRRVIRSEWIKLRSVRSTIVTLGFAGVAVAVVGVLISMLSDGAVLFGDGEVVYDPGGNSLFGTSIAQLVLGVLGALLVTSEYATGLIRTTFAAVPKRLPVLWAKVVVVSGVVFATMVAGVGVAFFAGQALYSGGGVGASIFDAGVARALLGAAVFPTAIAVMGIALGVLMRHTAMAVGVLFGLLFLLPALLHTIGGVGSDIVNYLPPEAGETMTTIVDDPDGMSPLAGFAVLFGWVGALLATAATVLKRRDV